jgi:hypothetical protein
MERQIILEIYRSLVLLGADFKLLSAIGSWKDSLPDNDVLQNVKGWNMATLSELKERIEHYEISCPHQVCNTDVARQKFEAE